MTPAEHQNGFLQGVSLHGWGPFGQRGPELCRLAAAPVRRSPPGLRHLPAPRHLARRVSLVLTRAVLGAVQIPDAAAGLDARCRKLLVQPLRLSLEQTQMFREDLVVAGRHRAQRAIYDGREVNRPPLTLQVAKHAGILGRLLRACLGQP